ncbi:hypothetical protein NDU88_002219 [Pleurodeles waltl]|uniref:Uncharacterized protein n=1 Tax=Pleurodeles waltl TaxID=8319 RepID=A0AAV7V9X3_PLEWA|nr:hypothetical protein NDU88_002219 [Pleurodeles waltl]
MQRVITTAGGVPTGPYRYRRGFQLSSAGPEGEATRGKLEVHLPLRETLIWKNNIKENSATREDWKCNLKLWPETTMVVFQSVATPARSAVTNPLRYFGILMFMKSSGEDVLGRDLCQRSHF